MTNRRENGKCVCIKYLQLSARRVLTKASRLLTSFNGLLLRLRNSKFGDAHNNSSPSAISLSLRSSYKTKLYYYIL